MSSILLCPSCRRKLRVPETALGKTLRCPDCRALFSAESDPDLSSPSRAVKTAPSPPAAGPTLSRPPRNEEPEEERQPAEEPIPRRSVRRDEPVRNNSSAGLIIGLAVGGGMLLLLVLLAGGGALAWFFMRTPRMGASPVQSTAFPPPNGNFPNLLPGKAPRGGVWQTFAPPKGSCSVLMPGTPLSQPMTSLGFTLNKYLLTRLPEKDFYVVAFGDFGPDPLPRNIGEIMANAERDHLLRTLHGQATRETAITLGNLPGREIQLSIQPRGTIVERIYLAKINGIHRVFIVVAAGDLMTPTSAEATRFFGSFKIEGAPQPPTYVDGAALPGGVNRPPFIMNPPQFKPPFPPPPGIPGPQP